MTSSLASKLIYTKILTRLNNSLENNYLILKIWYIAIHYIKIQFSLA